jgi:hypothetical protein
LSEFLHRLQERLRKRSESAKGHTDKDRHPFLSERLEPLINSLQQSLIASKNRFAKSGLNSEFNASSIFLPLNRLVNNFLKPSPIIQSLTYIGMLVTLASATYWLMHLAQIPSPPDTLNKNAKGAILYSNQDITESYALFGSKPVATENIVLRGVVVTNKNKDGLLEGFALFEIDGKPSGAIAVGESVGKGLLLQTITPDTATLLYQGKRLNFSLNKVNKDKQVNKRGSSSNTTASSLKINPEPNTTPKIELSR